MENIHILPTDKPSRLYFTEFFEELVFTPKYEKLDGVNIYITSDEEIKDGDWCRNSINEIFKVSNLKSYKYQFSKIILTTDQELIKDGVQAIDDEFLEWFVKNPSCEYIKTEKWLDDEGGVLYSRIIPKEEPKSKLTNQKYLDKMKTDGVTEEFLKQETLEEVAEQYTKDTTIFLQGVEEGIREQQERSYSEEEVLKLILTSGKLPFANDEERIQWFQQFKKK